MFRGAWAHFRVGAALNEEMLAERDTVAANPGKTQFNTVTADGVLDREDVERDRRTPAPLTIAAFAQLGVPVVITELDVDLLPRATPAPGADVTPRKHHVPGRTNHPLLLLDRQGRPSRRLKRWPGRP